MFWAGEGKVFVAWQIDFEHLKLCDKKRAYTANIAVFAEVFRPYNTC
jgi:hypothetical protein